MVDLLLTAYSKMMPAEEFWYPTCCPTVRCLNMPSFAGRGVRWLREHVWLVLRTLFCGYLMLQLAPAPARLMPYPPQMVNTEHPVVCIHTRLTDEVRTLKFNVRCNWCARWVPAR